MAKSKDSTRLDRLEELLGGMALQVQKLVAAQEAKPALEPPAFDRSAELPRLTITRQAPGGPPSAFMAYVNAKRGERAAPLEDDPEAGALDAAAEKLASMGPVEKQAFLDEQRQKGRRADLRKARKEMDLPDLSDAELDELLGAPSE